jgi:hypothetical protein
MWRRKGYARGRHCNENHGRTPFLSQSNHVSQIVGGLLPVQSSEHIITTMAVYHESRLLTLQYLSQA